MKTQIIPQLSKYLNATPAYTPRGKVGRILSIVSEEDDDIEIEGELPNLNIPNREEGVNGGGFSGSREFKIPFGRNKKTREEVVLTANCTVTLTVDDWGSVSIDGEKVVDLTSAVEPGGQHGGHTEWTDSGSISLKSGSHTLSYESTNVDIPHESYNVSICDVNLTAAWEEDGGEDDKECDCNGTCSDGGGENPPETRGMGTELPKYTTSSAGSAVNASLEEEKMRWNCSFGVLRGFGTTLSGKVELKYKELTEACASPKGLLFNHPLNAYLKLPENGVFKLGDRVEIMQGARVIALRSYANGRVVAVGVDTGEGQATLLAGNTKLQWQNNEGQKWVFSVEDGSLLEYVGANGVKVTDVGAYLQVRRDGSGAIAQIWSYWDGLLQVEDATAEGYRIALYTASQVQGLSVEGCV